MIKKTIVKYVYFAVLLLLPFTLAFLPFRGLNPFTSFLEIPWLFFNISLFSSEPVMFRSVIYCIIYMLVNFFITSRLYVIRKDKSIRRNLGFFLLIFVLYMLCAILLGEAGIGFALLFWGSFHFCSIYFFGILIYHRYINPT